MIAYDCCKLTSKVIAFKNGWKNGRRKGEFEGVSRSYNTIFKLTLSRENGILHQGFEHNPLNLNFNNFVLL